MFGKLAFTAKLRNGLFRNIGACIAPQTAFYNLLGMETLGLRMERACSNALKLAKHLEDIKTLRSIIRALKAVIGMGQHLRYYIMDLELSLQ